MAKKAPSFSAPIPGQSLTAEPGSRPWEKPPKYVTAEDALTFYIEDLSQPTKLARMLDEVERGAPIALMVDTLQLVAVSRGLHTVDVGIIISPVLVEFIKTMAEQEGIEYSIADGDEEEFTEEEAMLLLSESKNMGAKEEEEESIVPPPPEGEQPRGLMARQAEQEETEEMQDGV